MPPRIQHDLPHSTTLKHLIEDMVKHKNPLQKKKSLQSGGWIYTTCYKNAWIFSIDWVIRQKIRLYFQMDNNVTN